ncbi:MAG: DNA repair protein RadA [Geminicoccaceae bacterium]
MARTAAYQCQSCGALSAKWTGRCDACGAWNALVEERVESVPRGRRPARRSSDAGLPLATLGGASDPPPRLASGSAEFDRVLGGGIVPGSAVLIGGDPGIGKSTLMLQTAACLAAGERACVYVSGEESLEQIRLRARRLGLADAPVQVAAATNVLDILRSFDAAETAPAALIIDSVQTLYLESLESAPGTVAQLRASADELIRMAKRRGIALFLIGHVTKDGQIAGPRVLEHMVDAVLYFEGERGHAFRLLRAVKNRFGPANEIGVFEMAEAGLVEVANPSALFLADHDDAVAGSAVFAGMEGSRPILLEVQALIAPSTLAQPRRAVVGWDTARLAMLLAVLEARCGLVMAGRDVYLNVAGGLRVQEPACDLAVAAALLSSLAGKPLPRRSVFCGEVGLAGEVRPVAQLETRLREAAKLGFERAVVPRAVAVDGLTVRAMRRLDELVARCLPAGSPDAGD